MAGKSTKKQDIEQTKALTNHTNHKGNGTLSDDQVELLASKLAEKEVEARERLQVMRDLFPRSNDEMLMMGRTPSNMILPLARHITWMAASDPNRKEGLASIHLKTLLRLLIGKEGAARYETLAAYEANAAKRQAEEEGEL